MVKNRRQFLRFAGTSGTIGLAGLLSGSNAVAATDVDGSGQEIEWSDKTVNRYDSCLDCRTVSHEIEQVVSFKRKSWEYDDDPDAWGLDSQAIHTCDLLGLAISRHEPYYPAGLIENIGIRMDVSRATPSSPNDPGDTKTVAAAPLLDAEEIDDASDISLSESDLDDKTKVEQWISDETELDADDAAELLSLASIAASHIAGRVHPAGSIAVSLASMLYDSPQEGSWELDYAFNFEETDPFHGRLYERAAVVWVSDFEIRVDDAVLGQRNPFEAESYVTLNHETQRPSTSELTVDISGSIPVQNYHITQSYD